MKSISFGIGYLLAVLVVHVSSADFLFNVLTTPIYSPYNFGYKASNSLLIMEITLTNIPPSVTAVTAIQSTYYDYDQYNSVPLTYRAEVNVDKNSREGKLLIVQPLKNRQIWVDVQLHNGVELCYETRIIEGREIDYQGLYYWDITQSKSVYHEYIYGKYEVNYSCLAPKACKLILDLKDTCKEQQKSTDGDVKCNIEESQYICTFARAATNVRGLTLSQTYEDNSVIGPVLKIEPQTTILYIKLELFDNNTSVKIAPSRSRNKSIWSDTLSITAQYISKGSNVTILKYTETTNVQFSCEQYKNRSTQIYVGAINTTDGKITTHNTINNKFKMADNGIILCCLFYESKTCYGRQEMTRFVEKKTLLTYQLQESTSTNLTERNEQKKAACHDKWWIYVLPTLLGTAILLLTLYIVMKQRWFTNSQPAEETVELDNYAPTNQVLYANLDFVHNESRARNQTEESPYANIAGVLHPL